MHACIVSTRRHGAHCVTSARWGGCRYWSVTTLSTVGYGDIVPHEDKPLFACFFLAACVIFAFILGETVALLQEVGRHQRLETFFHDGLSRPVLDAMDVLNDGRVRCRLLACIPTETRQQDGRPCRGRGAAEALNTTSCV